MKRILEFADKHPKAIAIVLGSILLIAILSIAIPAVGTAINDRRVGKLEEQKQEALKNAKDARARLLILEGIGQAKDEQIKALSSQIEQSNQRVSNAHNETVSARANYQKFRNDPVNFNSADDAGRVAELGTELQRLYSDTP